MAAVSTTEKINFKLLLENGTTASGDVKTVTVSLPRISPSGYTDDKAVAVANAIEPVLSKSIYVLNKVITSRVDEE